MKTVFRLQKKIDFPNIEESFNFFQRCREIDKEYATLPQLLEIREVRLG